MLKRQTIFLGISIASLLISICMFICYTNDETPFTDSEQQYIDSISSIKALYGHIIPPDAFYDEDGNFVGILADYQHLISEITGLDIEVKNLRTWEKVLTHAQNNNEDYVIFGITRTREREEYLNFTNSILTFPYVIVGRKGIKYEGIKDLKNYTVCTPTKYAVNEYMHDNYPEIKLKHFVSDLECLRQLALGRVDFTILNQLNVTYITQKEAFTNLKIYDESGYTNRLCIATPKKNPQLFRIFDRAVDAIDKEQRRKIYDKWVNVEGRFLSHEQLIFFLSVLILIFLILLALWAWSISLKRQVYAKTKELIFAKERAEESDRLKSAFLANISHEIRTPMNGILGFTDLLRHQELNEKRKQKYLEIIERSGKRMLSTIDNIIVISRLEARQIKLQKETFQLGESFNELYKSFEPETDKKGISLICKNLNSEEKIFTDREVLNTIYHNLLKNAIKFTDKGFIEFGITSSKNNNEMVFYVKDTGIGIAKERQKAIFNRFVMGDIEDKEAREGSGLGLAICKGYIDLLGGDIAVKSTENKGAYFTFTLPTKK